MFDVVTFGETMLRLAAPPFRRLEQTSTLEVTMGGSLVSKKLIAAGDLGALTETARGLVAAVRQARGSP